MEVTSKSFATKLKNFEKRSGESERKNESKE